MNPAASVPNNTNNASVMAFLSQYLGKLTPAERVELIRILGPRGVQLVIKAFGAQVQSGISQVLSQKLGGLV